MQKGCSNCRRRHSKCVVRPGASVCTRCAESETDKPCSFEPAFRLKHVQHIYDNTGGARSKVSLTYNEHQTWVPISGPLKFFLESADGDLDFYLPEAPATENNQTRPQSSTSASNREEENALSQPHQHVAFEAPELRSEANFASPVLTTPPALSRAHHVRDHSLSSGHRTFPFIGPEHHLDSTLGQTPSTVTSTFTGAESSLSHRLQERRLSRREAFLLRSFIDKLAPWVKRTRSFASRWRS